jgi:hypothetical protein
MTVTPTGDVPVESIAKPPKAAKAPKAPRGEGKPKKAKADKGEPRPKRGPARPYRKLGQDTLDTRIAKLQKRMDRARTQAGEAEGFLVKYAREQAFRTEEAAGAVA